MSRKCEVTITSRTGEQLNVQAVTQLAGWQILLSGNSLVFGEGFYWNWDTFVQLIPGAEESFFKIRDDLRKGKPPEFPDSIKHLTN